MSVKLLKVWAQGAKTRKDSVGDAARACLELIADHERLQHENYELKCARWIDDPKSP